MSRTIAISVLATLVSGSYMSCTRISLQSHAPSDSDPVSFNRAVSGWDFNKTYIGLNTFDLAGQYTGMASGGDASPAYAAVTQAMARQRILDAKHYGATFLRLSVMGYGDTDLTQAGWSYQKDADGNSAYWAKIDLMFRDVESAGLQIVPTFLWYDLQLPKIVGNGETLRDLITNPGSQSYTALTAYVSQFINRYKDHSSILFYELTNELNTAVDADNTADCPASGGYDCQYIGNITTQDLISFTQRYTAFVRSIDSSRPLSSGYALPPPYAQHLRQNPQFNPSNVSQKQGGNFGNDSFSQMMTDILDQNQHFDFATVHLYGPTDMARFGDPGASLLGRINNAVQGNSNGGYLDKHIYLGEFGTSQGYQGDISFMQQYFNEIVGDRIPFASIWDFENYQFNTYTTQNDIFNIIPGVEDPLLAAFQSISKAQGTLQPPSDSVPPLRTVLTWPIPGNELDPSQLVFATASSDAGPISKVEFLVDDVLIGTTGATPPFQVQWDTTQLVSAHSHRILARAYDSAGNMAESQTLFAAGGAPGITFTVSDSANGDGDLAPDALASIYGSGLPSNATVWVNGEQAQISYQSSTQINFVIPSDTPVSGNGHYSEVEILGDSGLLGRLLINVDQVKPAIFTMTGTGSGYANGQYSTDLIQYPAIATITAADPNGSGNPIPLGGENSDVYLFLYGTGWRHNSGLSNVQLMLPGNVAATVLYAGAQNTYAGLDQLNAKLPSNYVTTSGQNGAIPIHLTVDGVDANDVWIQVGN